MTRQERSEAASRSQVTGNLEQIQAPQPCPLPLLTPSWLFSTAWGVIGTDQYDVCGEEQLSLLVDICSSRRKMGFTSDSDPFGAPMVSSRRRRDDGPGASGLRGWTRKPGAWARRRIVRRARL